MHIHIYVIYKGACSRYCCCLLLDNLVGIALELLVDVLVLYVALQLCDQFHGIILPEREEGRK